MTAVAIQRRDEIIEQVANGEMLQVIAQRLGIAAPNISKHLADDPEYRKAREIGAELRLHLAYTRMDECAEGELVESETGEKVLVESKGNLARAREAAFRAAAWFAEREFPHRWGQKQTVTVNQGITLDGALDQIAGAVLDRMKVVSDQSTGQEGQIESDIEQKIGK